MNPFEGYRVTSPYGWRIHPVYKERRFHTGIDLVKSHKAPILAFTDGSVIFAGFAKDGTGLGGMGNVVCVVDKYGHNHVYAHLDSVSVKVGDKVKKGQEVGKQGNTGISTGSHLHYEVRKKSSPSYGYNSNREAQCFEPTQYLIDFYSKEEKEKTESEDDAPMKLADWEKSLLINAVNKFSKTNGVDGKPVINSPDTWIKKINDGTITAGEVAILNMAILSRMVK